MLLRLDNIFFRTIRGIKVIFILSSLVLFSYQARAANLGQLMLMPEFLGLCVAIGNLNRAMREAAENPMDQWRRHNVHAAMTALPPAIIALAEVFKAGKLHDGDLPFVQSILGGYIDVNAADNYKKFLKDPRPEFIPQVGDKFPKSYLQGPPSSAAVASARISGNPGPVSAASSSIKVSPNSTSIEYDDNAKTNSTEGGDTALNAKLEAAAEANKDGVKKLDSLSIRFDDKEAKARSPSAGSDNRGNAAEAGSFQVNEPEVSSGTDPERADSEALLTIIRGKSEKSDALEDGFFNKVTANADGKKKKSQSKSMRENLREFRLDAKPKYWGVTPFARIVESLILKEASAAAPAGGGANDSGCPNCAGKEGGGGEGGGGGGGGFDAAGILFGVAAIISAISPMIVADIQAEADKDIARANADAQKWMLNKTAETSKFLSNQQKDIAMAQTDAAQKMAQKNNEGVSQRLAMQLAELKAARESQDIKDAQKLALEKNLNQQRIELANKQADDNLKLAKQTLNAQLTQAGMSTGVANSRDSGSSLTTSRVATTRTSSSSSVPSAFGTTPSALAQASGGSPYSSSLGTPGSGSFNSPSVQGYPGLSMGSMGMGVTGNQTPKLNAVTSTVKSGVRGVQSGQSRLLSVVSSHSSPSYVTSGGEKLVYDDGSGKWLSDKEWLKKNPEGSSPGRGIASQKNMSKAYVSVGKQLSEMLLKQSVIRGSSPKYKVRSRITSLAANGSGKSNVSSDLNRFIRDSSESEGRSFVDYRRNGRAQKLSGHGSTTDNSTARGIVRIRGAYNPPASGHSGRDVGGAGR